MPKKNVLITAAGTASAWHLCNCINEDFNDLFTIHTADINPDYLTPSSVISKHHHQVPLVIDEGYEEKVFEILVREEIDIIIPLIDRDVEIFSKDNKNLIRNDTLSTSPSFDTSKLITDKKKLNDYLCAANIGAPKTFTKVMLLNTDENIFFMKPNQGFGSRGVGKISKEEALVKVEDESVLIQELCGEQEITVEVFNHDGIRTLCRERIETKAGVCTKTRIFRDEKLHKLAESLCKVLEMPVAFCFQVMMNKDGKWVITDLNPRIGAGTALVTAVGWSLTKAMLAVYAGIADPTKYLIEPDVDRYVTRVYSEIITV